MESLYTIREFNTRHFRVVVDAIPEDLPLDDVFDNSVTDLGELTDKINCGDLVYFCARVRVIHETLGEIASDYLGGCCYEWFDEFQDHRECAKCTRELQKTDPRVVCGSYFACMIAEAIKEARQTLADAQNIYIRKEVA